MSPAIIRTAVARLNRMPPVHTNSAATAPIPRPSVPRPRHRLHGAAARRTPTGPRVARLCTTHRRRNWAQSDDHDRHTAASSTTCGHSDDVARQKILPPQRPPAGCIPCALPSAARCATRCYTLQPHRRAAEAARTRAETARIQTGGISLVAVARARRPARCGGRSKRGHAAGRTPSPPPPQPWRRAAPPARPPPAAKNEK